ncbi:MAG: alpha/beta hydrolase domain-containing protein [Chloroflexi bacterium]|nr:alpha/beta hydrolase domain-containing protein [Chloroflexota bacterium]MDA1239681.1 alpha/beta hydrolase domain-containing protein [Chloroflexota bacterium]
MTAISVHIDRREAYADGVAFGEAGTYERIDGSVTFSVDPLHEANRAVVDLDLAPRDEGGRVRFTADFVIITPREAGRGNGALIVDVVNRGRPRAIPMLNRVGPARPQDLAPGDGFLFRHGFSVASIGWQWDVYREDGLLGFDAPLALSEGKPVTGQSIVEIRPNTRERTFPLANRGHRPYPAVDLQEPAARLIVRDFEDGEDTEVRRSAWQFARETPDGVQPSAEHIHMPDGFEPGRIYHVIYTATDARVVGTGLLAVREIASFLRAPSELNPCAAGFQRVIGFGVSQTGRFLRTLLAHGLNADESGRAAFDGLLVHIAGGRLGEFNHRFAQPSQQSVSGFGHRFPFADEPLTDPYSGETAGLLDRVRAVGVAPRVIYTNSSAEYWRGDGSLVHVDPAGERDLASAPGSRIYHFAGTQHTVGSVPQRREIAEGGGQGRYGANVTDYRPLLRAALSHLDAWIAEGAEPPPSRHARIVDGTAVPRATALAAQPLPGLVQPDPERLWVVRTVDLGPEAGRGIGRYPAVEGDTYAALVSAVDSDGNEVAGVRLPDLTVPVGTHLPWNPRHPDTGAAEQILPMQGSSHFFAPTRAARDATGDPRASIEERYPSREAYRERVQVAAEVLIAERYLLAEDLDVVIEACLARYHEAVAVAAAE